MGSPYYGTDYLQQQQQHQVQPPQQQQPQPSYIYQYPQQQQQQPAQQASPFSSPSHQQSPQQQPQQQATQHELRQTLTAMLGQSGQQALPYEEGLKYLIREQVAQAVEHYPSLRVRVTAQCCLQPALPPCLLPILLQNRCLPFPASAILPFLWN